MPLSVLIATGTDAAVSADTVLADGAQATLVLTGEGRAPVEVKISNGQYVRVAELTTTNAVQKIYGPAVFRVRRELVLPRWVPNGQPKVTVPFGVEVYTDAALVQSLTRAQLDAAAVKTEPLGRLGLAYQITAGAAASASLAFSAGVTRLRISARNANCRIAIGTGSQTATNTSGASTSHFLQADTSMDVACLAGSQISVIRGTDQTVDGIVHVSELI